MPFLPKDWQFLPKERPFLPKEQPYLPKKRPDIDQGITFSHIVSNCTNENKINEGKYYISQVPYKQ